MFGMRNKKKVLIDSRRNWSNKRLQSQLGRLKTQTIDCKQVLKKSARFDRSISKPTKRENRLDSLYRNTSKKPDWNRMSFGSENDRLSSKTLKRNRNRSDSLFRTHRNGISL